MKKTMKPPAITSTKPNQFCPGCGHGVAARLIGECIEELGYAQNVLMTVGVGCSCIYQVIAEIDLLQASHGRAAAVATGMKRVMPEKLVLCYQGDGDAYNIGLCETLNAAYRNEPFTVITVNNGNFGMTGGQMSWTTLPGQPTTTSRYGRNCAATGEPIAVPEIVAAHFRPAFVARGSVSSVAEIRKLRSYIKSAFEAQLNNEGYSLVEILSPCPTNWGLAPVDAIKRVKDVMEKIYPCGILKDRGGTS